ncbi:hypothetical protein HDV57DRAFT_81769 [Trichoderma longibrachiatum]
MKRRLLLPLSHPANSRKGGGEADNDRQGSRLLGIRAVHVIKLAFFLSLVSSVDGFQTRQGKHEP